MKRLRSIMICFALVLLSILVLEQTLRPVRAAVSPATYPYVVPWNAEQQAFERAVTLDTGLDAYLPGDYDGALFHAAHGIRATAGQPTVYTATIYLLGPSMVLDIYNPDADTLASRLQRYLPTYRVVSLGIQGGALPVFEARLRRDAVLTPGDIVILYDGSEVPLAAGNMALASLQRAYAASPCNGVLRAVSYLNLVHAACDWLEAPDFTVADVRVAVHEAAARYRRNLARLQAYVADRGAAFIHVNAPYLWSTKLSPRETTIHAAPGVAVAWPLAVEALHDTVDIDLGHVLDNDRARGVEVYLDYVHVSGEANARLARALVEELTCWL